MGNLEPSLVRKDPYWTQGVVFNMRHFRSIWFGGKLLCGILTSRMWLLLMVVLEGKP